MVSPVWEASKSCQRSVCQVRQSLPEGQENLFCDPAVPGCPGDEPQWEITLPTGKIIGVWDITELVIKLPVLWGLKPRHGQAEMRLRRGSQAHSAAKPQPPP